MVTRPYHSWIETANEDNATATATRADPNSGANSHYVTSISASFSATVSGALLTLKQGSTEIGRWYVYDAFALVFPSPVKLDPSSAVSLELAASGGAGTVGAVSMTGFTL